MKKTGKILLMAMALGLVICGIGFAGDELAPAGAPEIIQPDSIELTGTVLSDNTFVDENGENYQLLDSDASEDLQAYVGQKIKVTATVMESDEGLKNISISSYELVEDQ